MPLETATHIADLVSSNPASSDPVQQGADHLRLIKAALTTSFPNINAPVTATSAQINSWEGRVAFSEKSAPVGTVYMTMLAAAPTDHILLAGGTFNRADYPAFWTACGPSGSNVLGLGNGSTTFTVPDARLRFPLMAGTGVALGSLGGSANPAVTVDPGGDHDHGGTITGGSHTHATTSNGAHTHGGTQAHVLTWNEMPVHSHGVNDPGHSHSSTTGNVAFANEASLFLYPLTTGSGNYVGFGALSVGASGTGISIQNAGSNVGHAHGIASDGAHTHTAQAADHTHTLATSGAHTHTGTVAERPLYLALNFIVRAR
jgi:microcystin-dependent protein